MDNLTKGAIGVTVGLALTAGIATLIPDDPTITLNDPQKIQWNKPTTDAEWAEDVKGENFDIKSTEVLTEMRTSHAAKLEKIMANNKKILECPECIKYDLQAGNPDWTQQDVDNEYQNQLNQYLWDIEKLTQSVERMDNELRLREKGFVVPDKSKDGVKTKQSDLNKIDETYVRKIND